MSLTKPLRLQGITKRFGETRALTGLDLEVAESQIVALIGPSGCGKTTALRVVAGFEDPEAGSVEIDGLDARGVPPEARRVGFVFQDYALFPHLDVGQNVSFGLRGSARNERELRTHEVLELVGMADLAKKFPRELSGGQQQRVALARAIAPKPRILLLDEPLSNLDPHLRRRVRHEVLGIIRESSIAAVWVTHDHDEGLIVSDHVVVMCEGRARQSGTPAEIWRAPQDAWVASFIGRGDLLRGTVRSGLVETPLGTVRAGLAADGAPVSVLVMSEDVVMDSTGAPGTVVRRHFDGDSNVYCVQLEDGGLLHVKQPPNKEIPRGSRVRVKLARDDLPVYV